jgi:hypothetical protein
MAEEKSVSEKLDAIFDAFNKRMDAADEERKADKARLDAACSKLDAAEEEKKADKARKDAAEKQEGEAKAKKDAAEKEEKERADAAARKDAEEKEEKARADAAASRATDPALAARIAAIESQIAVIPDDQRSRFVDTYAKAERVTQAFGDSAGARRWHPGESHLEYRRQFLNRFKSHSAQWKDVDLTPFADKALDTVETQIYADAMLAAVSPASVPVGTLRESTRMDQTGRRIHEFHGDPEAAWSAFKYPTRIVTGWQTKFN